MRAIRVHEFGGPEVLRPERVADPVPGPGQVLIRVHAAGINPVDTYIRAGRYGPREFPYAPGLDASGVIEAIGDGATGFSLGDRVYTHGTVSGAYAELTVCDVAQVERLPDGLSFAQGAGIGVPCGTAHRALFGRGGARSGETVLIHGATGGVGSAAVQLARDAGLTVIATGGSEPGRRMLLDLGAHHVLDHTQSDYLRRIPAITDGRGVDLIVENLANVNLGRDLEVLAKRGRVVVVGSRGRVEIDPRDTMSREADIRGLMLFAAGADEMRGMYAAINQALSSGALRIIIGTELPLEQAADAHRRIIESRAVGKVVLVPG